MQEWTVERLLQQSSGYWVSSALHAGVKHDLFTPTAAAPHSFDELVRRSGCNRRGLGMLLDALVALGLLDKQGGSYRATPFAAKFLNRDHEHYLGHIILHHHHLMESWAHLDRSVKEGTPYSRESLHDEDEWRSSFLKGMYNLASLRAPQVAKLLPLEKHCRVLDLGGGPGTYAIHFCRTFDHLQATVFDLPASRPIAAETVASFGLEGRIDFVGGDFYIDPLPTGYDVVWLSHILHADGPERCRELLAKAVAALEPGGLLLVQEFILDDDGCSPLFPTLFALNMLVRTDEGQAYREKELVEMLAEVGLKNARRLEEQERKNGIGIVVGEKSA